MNTLLGFRPGLAVLAYALKTVLVETKRFFRYLVRGLRGKGGKIALLKQWATNSERYLS